MEKVCVAMIFFFFTMDLGVFLIAHHVFLYGGCMDSGLVATRQEQVDSDLSLKKEELRKRMSEYQAMCRKLERQEGEKEKTVCTLGRDDVQYECAIFPFPEVAHTFLYFSRRQPRLKLRNSTIC